MTCSQDKLPFDVVLTPNHSDNLIVFAHGAGANMHHEYMVDMSDKLMRLGFQVCRFNFLYMQANMQDGKRRPPDRAPKLLSHFEQVLLSLFDQREAGTLSFTRIILVGKSMGGRMAAMLTSDEYTHVDPRATKAIELVSGIVCLGYPFIPLSGGEPRLLPLQKNSLPILIVQGERDKFGNKVQVPLWDLGERVTTHWLADGDHSFTPRKSSGYTVEQNRQNAVQRIAQFINENLA